MDLSVIVKGCSNNNLNGIYVKKINSITKHSMYFYKDEKHQIYRRNGIWRIGNYGKEIYCVLNECKNKKWNLKLLNLSKDLNIISNDSIKNNNNNDYINICFCSDVNLIDFIPTVINSIQNKNMDNNIKIHYIHNITDNNRIEKLKNYILQFPNLSFKSYYKTWDYKYKGIKHITSGTMLRLFIPQLIQEKKVLYLDIDIIVNIDLKRIYKINCNDTGIALKNSITYSELRNKKSGNCGVMLMELDKLRQNNFTEKCLNIHKNNNNRHDQYIINIYCDGNHTLLRPNHNIFLNQDMHIINNCERFILHYAGKSKPYYVNTGSHQYLWDKFYVNNY